MPRRLAICIGLLAAYMACGTNPPACTREGIHAMRRQPKLIPYDPSPFFADGMAMRHPPAGTVPSDRNQPATFLAGRHPDGHYLDDLPVPVTEELLELGERRFRATCAACHGLLGDGHSLVATRMALRAPANLLAQVVDLGGQLRATMRLPPPRGLDFGPDYLKGPDRGVEEDRDHQGDRLLLRDPLPVGTGRLELGEGLHLVAPGYVFGVITEGFGMMPGLVEQLRPLDRWAVIAYLAALQLSQRAPLARLPLEIRRRIEGAR